MIHISHFFFFIKITKIIVHDHELSFTEDHYKGRHCKEMTLIILHFQFVKITETLILNWFILSFPIYSNLIAIAISSIFHAKQNLITLFVM